MVHVLHPRRSFARTMGFQSLHQTALMHGGRGLGQRRQRWFAGRERSCCRHRGRTRRPRTRASAEDGAQVLVRRARRRRRWSRSGTRRRRSCGDRCLPRGGRPALFLTGRASCLLPILGLVRMRAGHWTGRPPGCSSSLVVLLRGTSVLRLRDNSVPLLRPILALLLSRILLVHNTRTALAPPAGVGIRADRPPPPLHPLNGGCTWGVTFRADRERTPLSCVVRLSFGYFAGGLGGGC